jgi:hypothetical protein
VRLAEAMIDIRFPYGSPKQKQRNHRKNTVVALFIGAFVNQNSIQTNRILVKNSTF